MRHFKVIASVEATDSRSVIKGDPKTILSVDTHSIWVTEVLAEGNCYATITDSISRVIKCIYTEILGIYVKESLSIRAPR